MFNCICSMFEGWAWLDCVGLGLGWPRDFVIGGNSRGTSGGGGSGDGSGGGGSGGGGLANFMW